MLSRPNGRTCISRETFFPKSENYTQRKVSLPDEWREKFLAKLESENKESRYSSDLFAQNLRDQISAIKTRLERLTDAYLGEALECVKEVSFATKLQNFEIENRQIEEE